VLRVGLLSLIALVAVVALVAVGTLGGAARAAGGPVTKVVRYHGYKLTVPAGWPVYRLAGRRTECARFDRHAVYLGRPGADQRCPAGALGHTEAVLVEPLRAASGRGAATGQTLLPSNRRAQAPGGSSARIVDAARGVTVIATWNQHPGTIQRALGLRSLRDVEKTSSPSRSRLSLAVKSAAARAHSAGVKAKAATVGAVYTGLGFDVCSTPSTSQMAAWSSSPFHAVGVYIGGTNMGCSQPNLNASWVSQETAAGWRLIPIYVSLQANPNNCGCSAMSNSPSTASSQGTAAAQDAVVQAQAVGIGPGNPIYDDMEGYNTTSSTTNAVMAFLAAWTTELHANGYQSGVYSSGDSGIRDLAARFGTGYPAPDDLWIARWNGVKGTADPSVPSTAWASHQRLHQYSGGVNETFGGVTLNIDGDYLDGATAGVGGIVTPSVAAAPSLSVSPASDGSVRLSPSWSGATGISSWQVLGGSDPGSLTPVASPVGAGAGKRIVMRSAYPYFAVQALGSTGQVLGSSPAVATPVHVAIYGRSAFVVARGLGGLPVGCFNSTPCHVSTTVTVGGLKLVTTGRETIPAGGGLAFFKLSRSGQTMLKRALHNRLGVTITVRDASGKSATRALNLVQFKTSGASPRHSLHPSSAVRVIGATHFVSNGWVGGILVACTAPTPCLASSTITSGGKTIARGTPQFLGVNELGYLHFSLTAAGHRRLRGRHGNPLGAKLQVSTGGSVGSGGTTTSGGATAGGGSTASAPATASAEITLASFR
jgi:hypothetical protein